MKQVLLQLEGPTIKTVGQTRKRAPKKEKAEKKPKAKKIKQEPKGRSQSTLDERLKKGTPLNGFLKKQSSLSSRNVSFLFKVEVRNIYKNVNLRKKNTFLRFNSGGRLCKTPFALKRREQKKVQK